jgi:hypothetical protein
MNAFRKILVLVVMLMCLLTLVGTASADCTPGPDEVAVYTGASFTGQCRIKGFGTYGNSGAIGLPDNSIRSIKVGSQVQATLYKDPNLQGQHKLFQFAIQNLGTDPILGNQVSSMKVDWRPCFPSASQVALYDGPNFTGRCVTKNVGQFADASAMGLPNNSVSSLKVGASVSATLYHHANFDGTHHTFMHDVADLGQHPFGSDRASSLKVKLEICQPGPYEIALYDEQNYQKGRCVIKGVGEYAKAAEMGLADNIASSIIVGEHVQATLYPDAHFGGQGITFVSSDPNLIPALDNAVSSMKVRCRPDANQIALFAGKNYTGACVVRGIGEHRGSQAIGLTGDPASLKVGATVKVRLYDYLDRYIELSADDHDLDDNLANLGYVTDVIVLPK